LGGESVIRFAEVLPESVVDGTGIRTVAFLQGCPRHCPSCHNEKLLSPQGGITIAVQDFAELILSNITVLHKGITFSGGDPLMQADKLYEVIAIIRKRMPKLDIWVYTGYLYEEVQNHRVMDLIDVVVDGPFILAQKDLSLAFRGSRNQRIIDVKKTKQLGKVVELYSDQLSKAV
jgi:anaerobic ribonucleoside-triphosphate reductase activating protein